jgi:hypothetical protein
METNQRAAFCSANRLLKDGYEIFLPINFLYEFVRNLHQIVTSEIDRLSDANCQIVLANAGHALTDCEYIPVLGCVLGRKF